MDLDTLPVIRSALGRDRRPPAHLTGSSALWAGPFAVDDLAVSCVLAATEAAADLLAVRSARGHVTAEVEATGASATFRSESLVEAVGWTVPPVWDPIAGDYPTADGWVRLHTNYPHHRRAALEALDLVPPDDADDADDAIDRAAVGAAVAGAAAVEIEELVVAAGGVAAAARTQAEWAAHAAGVVRDEPLLDSERTATTEDRPAWGRAVRPFDGIRVLDLTRVLAGPTATGFLAAWGADVLRIDPPGFPEVEAVLPITTATKRCAALDLRHPEQRDRLEELVDAVDVVVHGYRPDALGALGIDPRHWHERRPGLVEVTLDAYGWRGPWSTRRGFDSIVQHSVGITTAGRDAVGVDRPVPLPCQALDHGAGWLLAAAAAQGLVARATDGTGSRWRTSLARVAELLTSLPRTADPRRPAPTLEQLAEHAVVAETAWGPLRRLAWPGRIDGRAARHGPAGPVGRTDVSPAWRTTRPG